MSIIDTDKILNNAKVLADLVDQKMEELTHAQLRELEKAIEACFLVIERRKK